MAQLDRPTGQFKIVQSDLFECEVHFEEVGDIICLAAVGKHLLLIMVVVLYNLYVFRAP